MATTRRPQQTSHAVRELDAVSVADAVWLASLIGERSRTAGADEAGTTEKGEHFAVSISVDEEPEQAEPHPHQRPAEESPPSGLAPVRPPTPLSETHKRTQQPGTHARVGGLRTLADPQGFRAALRAFRTKPRAAADVLDEAATVDSYAEHGQALLVPVMQRGSRRWLRLSLVVEATATNALWSQSIDELESMAREQGAFRQVKRWALSGDQGACLQPVGRQGTFGRAGMHLASTPFWKDEVVVLISDFTSAHWWNGTFAKALRWVASSQPVALMQTLPERLWNRSWAGRPDAFAYAPAPACATSALQVCGSDSPASRNGLMVPLIGMTSVSFRNWSRALMNCGSLRMPCIALEAHGWAEIDAPVEDAARAEPVAVDMLLMTYNMASSALARRLAGYMAVTAPLTFPVMRWVQQATLPESDSSHLAEFVLGGLLQQVGGDTSTSADDVVYDFVSGTREALQSGIPINHAIEVLQTVGAFLEANQRGTLDSRTGIATWPDKDLDELSPELRAFALVSRDFLARIGLAISRAEVPLARAKPEPVTRLPAPIRQDDSARAEYSRRLRSRIIDIQWSPTEEGLLAILHEGGVELWDVLHEEKGVLIGSGDTPPASVSTIYWFAGTLGRIGQRQMAFIRAILKLLADGLESAGVRVVAMTQIRSLAKLREGRPGAVENPLLIVFESEHMFDTSGQEALALDGLYWEARSWLATGAIRLTDRAPQLSGFDVRLDLAPFVVAIASYRPSRRAFAGKMGQFVRSLSRQMMSSGVTGLSGGTGATAISWLDNGMLAVAERRGETTVINEIDAADVVRRRLQTFTSQRVIFSGKAHVQRMICLPLSSSGRYSSGVDESREVLLAWIDNDGALSIHGQIRAPGNGLARILAGAGVSHVAISNHGLGLNFIAPIANKESPRNVELVPSVPRNLDADASLESFIRERIIAVQANGSRVMALTSLGALHRGRTSEHENSKALSDHRAYLDPKPMDLQGPVAAASFTGDGRGVCVVRPNGTLELWDTGLGMRLDRLVLALGGIRSLRPSLAISPDQQLVASSNGKVLKIFRLIDDRQGGTFATPFDRGDAHVLWVDDRPENNIRERIDFKGVGIRFTLAQTTKSALKLLERYKFAAVISDMERGTGRREGYALLDEMRRRDDYTPVFFYTSSNSKKHKAEAIKHGAQGSTNDAEELFAMVMKVTRP
jgi:CheY-like chemotaxis protein